MGHLLLDAFPEFAYLDLGLADNPVDAGKLLSNRINRTGRHRLTDDDVWRIRELARERAQIDADTKVAVSKNRPGGDLDK